MKISLYQISGFLLLLGAALGLGFMLGQGVNRPAEREVEAVSSSPVTKGLPARSHVPPSTGKHFSGATAVPPLEVAVSAPLKKARVSLVDSAGLGSSDPMEQHVAFASLLLKGRRGSIGPSVRGWESQELDVKWQRDALYDAWGRKNPAEAVAYLTDTFSEGDEFTSRATMVARAWAESHPQAAYTWSLNQDPVIQDQLLSAIVEGAASTAPDFAMNLLESFPEGVMRGKASDAMVQRMIPGQQASLRARIDSLPTGLFKEGLVRQAALHSAGVDGHEAARWAESLPFPDDKATAVYAVASRWGKSEPEKAMVWAEQLTESIERERAIALVLDRWSLKDQKAAGEWLVSRANLAGMDQAIVRYAYKFQQKDPETAVTWALSIQDENLRHRTMSNLAKVWKQASPETATEFFEW